MDLRAYLTASRYPAARAGEEPTGTLPFCRRFLKERVIEASLVKGVGT